MTIDGFSQLHDDLLSVHDCQERDCDNLAVAHDWNDVDLDGNDRPAPANVCVQHLLERYRAELFQTNCVRCGISGRETETGLKLTTVCEECLTR